MSPEFTFKSWGEMDIIFALVARFAAGLSFNRRFIRFRFVTGFSFISQNRGRFYYSVGANVTSLNLVQGWYARDGSSVDTHVIVLAAQCGGVCLFRI